MFTTLKNTAPVSVQLKPDDSVKISLNTSSKMSGIRLREFSLNEGSLNDGSSKRRNLEKREFI